MIARLEGIVVAQGERDVIVDVGGIGYRVYVTQATKKDLVIGEEVAFRTHLAVREDALDLFGFASEGELALFESLLSVSGIGPKSAMNILSGTGVEILRRAIGSNDPSYLTKVAGVGKKTAEKIVLELHDKIGSLSQEEHTTTAEQEALDALETLGYSIRDTRDVVRVISGKEESAGEIVRKALQWLGKK